MHSDEGMEDDQDDITILHDELGNPLPLLGSPPQFQFLSEGGIGGKAASAPGPPDTAGSTAALKTAYDHVCRQNGQLRKHVKAMTDKNKQMTMLAKSTPMAIFHTAASSGDIDEIHGLLESGIDINGRNSEGRTTLHTAAANAKPAVCNLLLHNKADPNAADHDGRAPIHMACRNGDVETCKILVTFGAVIDHSDRDGRTALHIAAANGHPDICRLLVGDGNAVDINEKDIYGQTAIMMAKKNHHNHVFQLLQDMGAELPPVDNADDIASSPSQSSQQQIGGTISKLQHIIWSLFHILTILVTKFSISSEFPDLKERIDRLKLASQNTLEEGSSELNELQSIEHTLEDVIELKEWVNHKDMQNSAANVKAADQIRENNAEFEATLAEAYSEIARLKQELAKEHNKKELLQSRLRSQENQIQRLMSDVENVDLYSATNTKDDQEEDDTYDIGSLFSKVSVLEKNSKGLKADVMKELMILKGHKQGGVQPRQIQQIRRGTGSSSLPDPQRNQYTGPARQSSSLNENGSARNYLHLHDIRLPPADIDQPQVTRPSSNATTVVSQGPALQSAVQQDHRPRHSSTGQILRSPNRRHNADYTRQAGPGSWPREQQGIVAESNRLSTSEPAKTQELGGTRQSARRFVARSPDRDVPKQPPFESVKGPPTIEYASQSQTRYVEGASQLHIFEDHIPKSTGRSSGGGQRVQTSQTAQVQNMYPVSCSDEQQRRGSRDQVIILPASGRRPQEGLWTEHAGGLPRDELATGAERTGQQQQGLNLGHHPAFVANPQTGGRRETPKTQMECPVCQKVFQPGTTEDTVTNHVNLHFDGDRPVLPDDFEVLQ